MTKRRIGGVTAMEVTSDGHLVDTGPTATLGEVETRKRGLNEFMPWAGALHSPKWVGSSFATSECPGSIRVEFYNFKFGRNIQVGSKFESEFELT